MSDAVLIEPDVHFIQDIVAHGGGDLKKCYQCATCSVTCALSPDDAPFPRRQMLRAQWGLKDSLMADPAIWLCHNCGDCTTRCPRGAKPGEVFGVLRAEAIKHFAFPHFLGTLLAGPAGLALLLAAGVVVFGLLALAGHPAFGLALPSDRPFEFADLYPVWALEALFFAVSGFLALAIVISQVRFVRALRASGATGPILPGLLSAARDIATHTRFTSCDQERSRYVAHLAVFWGFVGLATVGTVVGMASMAGVLHTPLAQTNPLKIFANAAGVVALVGAVLLLTNRRRDPARRAADTYFDAFFIWTLTGVIGTGAIVQILRLFQSMPWMYVVYVVHLILVFVLFVSAPYTKLAHVVYRTMAMAAAGRK
ncbi:MAG: quinone-interacting membrane-bound oxidoreductase complex subunit QmoC [Acidobacteria bacterium]|nr:quinone-interacting membrane-bound oxidoreductase complex subunit QmoC [Acidobacteriota bacterium]